MYIVWMQALLEDQKNMKNAAKSRISWNGNLIPGQNEGSYGTTVF